MWKLNAAGYSGHSTLEHYVLDALFDSLKQRAEIVYTRDPKVVNTWVRRNILLSQPQGNIIGFDTESKVSQDRNKPGRICVIQLAVVHNRSHMPSVLLFHAHSDSIYSRENKMPSELSYVLESESLLKLGIGIKGDAKAIASDYRVEMKGCIDLYGYFKKGLKKATSHAFPEVQVPRYKDITTSEWEVARLTDRQIMYAALDAIYGERLGYCMMNKGLDLKDFLIDVFGDNENCSFAKEMKSKAKEMVKADVLLPGEETATEEIKGKREAFFNQIASLVA